MPAKGTKKKSYMVRNETPVKYHYKSTESEKFRYIIYDHGVLSRVEVYHLARTHSKASQDDLKLGSIYIKTANLAFGVMAVEKITRSFEKINGVQFFAILADLKESYPKARELGMS